MPRFPALSGQDLNQCLLTLFALVLLIAAAPGPAQAQPGWVLSHQKISDTEGNFLGELENNDRFGVHVAALGDVDGDGIADIAVGAAQDDDGGPDCGAVWILYLNSDGTVKSHQKISATTPGFEGQLSDDDRFSRVTSIGDLDNDGIGDLAVGVHADDDGCLNCGAVWVLFMNEDETVREFQKISALEGGFTGRLDPEDHFGWWVTKLRDLDGDSNPELAVGAPGDDDGFLLEDTGAVWILFLDDDGTVKRHQKISYNRGGFPGLLDTNDEFGAFIAPIGDLNRDGIWDLAVGATADDDGGDQTGAVWILFLNRDGKVESYQKISATEGGFTGNLDPEDYFGHVMELPDIDGDGVKDLAVGAVNDDDGFLLEDVGAVWILFMNTDGTVKGHQKISATKGGFTGTLGDSHFGWGGVYIGDLNGDGHPELAVGDLFDDDGGGPLDINRGAVWILFLDGAVLTAAPEVGSSSAISLVASPNPFRGEAALQYALPKATAVRLMIVDSQGRRVATLVDREEAAGPHSVSWTGRTDAGAPANSGIYFAKLEAAGTSAVRKIVLVK